MKKVSCLFLIFLLAAQSACVTVESGPGEAAFRVSIRNQMEGEFYGLYYEYTLNGEAVGSGGIENADGSTLKTGESLYLDFGEVELGMDGTEDGLEDFTVELFALTKAGGFALTETECKEIPVGVLEVKAPVLGEIYSWTLAGSEKDGFSLEDR